MKKKTYFLLLFCIFYYIIACSTTAYGAESRHYSRITGNNVYETAVKVSQSKWEKAPRVILVSGNDFAATLCVAPLAKKLDAPILFTEQNKLTDETAIELLRLKPELIYIVGETGTIGEEVTNNLMNFGMEFTRIGGKDKFETSLHIADLLEFKGKIVVASSENYLDAISIAPIAAYFEMPILLTDPVFLPESVASYIAEKNSTTSYVVGGNTAIADNVFNALPNGKRLFGTNPYETNLAVLNEFEPFLDYNKVFVSTGENSTDALLVAPIASNTISPMLLINTETLPKMQEFIKSKLPKMNEIQIIGTLKELPTSLVKKMLGEKAYTIVLDPGHGGRDPGAISKSWLNEKDVNLQVALKVGKLLEENQIDVVYTRNSDVLPWEYTEMVDLQSRSDFANNLDTTYFVSIHSNSCPSPYVNGSATYYQNGREDSIRLAQLIQQQLVDSAGTKNNGILTANFYVLRNTDSPAVLIELAYLSNANEAALLGSESFQLRCANGIVKGILEALQ